MGIFYQQSGVRGQADFTKTLVSRDGSLRKFTPDVLRNTYSVSVPDEAIHLVQGTRGFQIWGVPSGADRVIQRMRIGDLVLLIGHLSKHSLQDGKFFYAGRVAYVMAQADFAFSRKLWGDGGFPLIFFMQGSVIDYSWPDFARDFRFKENYFVAGHIVRIPETRLRSSIFANQESLAARLRIDERSLQMTHRPTA